MKNSFSFQLGLMVNPLKPGDISYLKFATERFEQIKTTLSKVPSSFFFFFFGKSPLFVNI